MSQMTRLYTTHCTCTVFKKHLCLSHGADAFVVLRQEEADGHEELVDADPELLLVLASRGQREEPTRLDDVLEDVLAGLGVRGEKGENNRLSHDGKRKSKSDFASSVSFFFGTMSS